MEKSLPSPASLNSKSHNKYRRDGGAVEKGAISTHVLHVPYVQSTELHAMSQFTVINAVN